MTQLGEAIARYHRILEGEAYKDLSWAETLQEEMRARNLTSGGKPISPVLRPHFVMQRQYAALVKAAETLFSAIDRIKQLALSTPALLGRLELLPAEKMLAGVDPGYPFLAVTSRLSTHMDNGNLRFVDYNADTPTGVAYAEALNDLFYECPPVREFRKRYNLSKSGGLKHLLQSLLKAYKESGRRQSPKIAIVEFRQPFQTVDSDELMLVREFFRKAGYPTEIASPDQLEYRNGVLRRGDLAIDLVYRRVKVQEFLVRFDLNHPLVRAYREGAICMVNSFRSELAHKKAIFDLLTDETVTSGFPAAERKAIRDHIPWTRLVAQGKATRNGEQVDLTEFILKNRETLVLKPNDESPDQHSFCGWEVDGAAWERALKIALRSPYVVQERVASPVASFPVYQWGELQMRDLSVDLHPHAFLGRVQGCSSWVCAADTSGFSTLSGLAPTFIIENR
ncbi:MAG: hypothetical protein HY822_11270 [Acidobacteria bacterium]|nr:hypothetical protein [Acidobacteriota bacterium]